VEIAVGDLVSEESREFVLLTEVLPLPLLPGGKLPASLQGEELLGLEFVWTEICDSEIKSCHSTHLVRIQGTQNPEEVVLNQEVIVVVANQIAGKAAREAAAKAREGDFDAAARSIRSASAAVQRLAAPDLTGEARGQPVHLDTADPLTTQHSPGTNCQFDKSPQICSFEHVPLEK
jgi:hypothetical protein